jgi:hypothetical protein
MADIKSTLTLKLLLARSIVLFLVTIVKHSHGKWLLPYIISPLFLKTLKVELSVPINTPKIFLILTVSILLDSYFLQ